MVGVALPVKHARVLFLAFKLQTLKGDQETRGDRGSLGSLGSLCSHKSLGIHSWLA